MKKERKDKVFYLFFTGPAMHSFSYLLTSWVLCLHLATAGCPRGDNFNLEEADKSDVYVFERKCMSYLNIICVYACAYVNTT